MTKPSKALPSVVLKTPWNKRLLHFFGFRTGHDTNMPDAHTVGLKLCDHGYDTLSRSLWDAARLAEKVELHILGPMIGGQGVSFYDAPRLLGMDRCKAGEALRTWAGCMSGAKCIALGTRNGRNWPWWRRRQALRMERECERDSRYALGVMAAVAFKIGRNEAYSFFGVPGAHYLRMGAIAAVGSREPMAQPSLNVPATASPEAN